MKIDLYLTPLPFSRQEIEGKTVVVIDVLRCSTSICQALASGAKAVIPTEGRGEAGDIWTKIGSENAVLAGEQQGIKIENFMLGNSPREFTPEVVGGKFVIMATTNGTPLLKKTHAAKHVFTAAFNNISAVLKRIRQVNTDLIIACSGRAGHFSIEDTLCGGMIIERLKQQFDLVELNDAGKLALLLFQENKNSLPEAIREGEHGHYLEELGFGDDVTLATQIDTQTIVPVMKEGQLVLDE